ncbi:methionine aminopeptidase [Alteribacillus sp. JSM 102045]|uniref:methionine aminopeptidase n=1 Tax=Alteribacillus sp. JSM 102045 TaxID=1562101 RepID=UPI0035C12829
MGLFSSIKEWKKARQEKHIANMEAKGICPDCRGRGFDLYYPVEYYTTTPSVECPGCNGSGLFSDWNSQTSQ